MSIVTDFFEKNQIQYLATIGTDGKPKVRPFQFMLEEDGKLFFCTSNRKEVYKEIKKHPFVELCALTGKASVSGENFSWIRLNGKAVFSDNLVIKEKIQNGNALVKSIYKTPDNPDFEIFYLTNAKAAITDFSGNPPKTFNL